MASDDNSSFVSAFLLGALAGFVVGVLSAPRSGAELRHELNERTRGLREQAITVADDLRERAGNVAERVRHQVRNDADADNT